jgi:periplasmic protein CpxP/Spy
MKHRFTSFFAALLAVFAFSAVSFAQETTTPETPKTERGWGKFGGRGGKMHGGGHGKMGGGRIVRLMSELNLSETQKQQINTLIEANKNATLAQREEMRQLWSQKRSGATLTAEQETRARELRTQLFESGKKLQEDLLAVLTPEQKTQLEQKRQEMRQRKMERRQLRQNSTNPTEPQS